MIMKILRQLLLGCLGSKESKTLLEHIRPPFLGHSLYPGLSSVQHLDIGDDIDLKALCEVRWHDVALIT